MFRIAICEDNPKDAEMILSLLTRFQTSRPGINFQIQSFDSGNKLLENIKKEQAYDLFLLDVLMPGITGIELAQKLRIENEDIPIVFMTSSPDYALSAYKVSAVQYILKPVSENEIFSVLDKILAFRKLEKDQFFILSTLESTLKVSFSTIVYVEITGHIIRVRLENGDIFSSKNIRVPFRTAVAPLLEDSRFLHAHKSYVLNMDHVQELRSKSFIMTGGYVLPVPKYKFTEAKDMYFRYLSRYGFGSFGG